MLNRRSYVVLVVAFLGACGKHETPTSVSSPSPVPVVAATPTPAPTPSFPGANSCSRLPIQTKDIGNCPVEGANFQKQVDLAVAQVRATQPEIFADAGPNTLVLSSGRLLVGVIENLDKMGLCAGFDSEEIQVTNDPSFNDGYLDIYHQWFIDAMVQRGYCAWWDSEEVQVKKENRFSEHYKIFLSDGHVRRVDGGAYRSTCWPAAF